MVGKMKRGSEVVPLSLPLPMPCHCHVVLSPSPPCRHAMPPARHGHYHYAFFTCHATCCFQVCCLKLSVPATAMLFAFHFLTEPCLPAACLAQEGGGGEERDGFCL